MLRSVLFTVLSCLGLCLAAALPVHASDGRVGGPCRYADFPGQAVITAVSPWQPDAPGQTAGTPYPPLRVTFTFTPVMPLEGEPLYRPGRAHTLTLVNGMPPGPRFVAKYGIAPGKVFPCLLRVIRQGTCTPVLFAFPAIDQTDYFELRQPPTAP